MPSSEPKDPDAAAGLASERTFLAWQRTALSLVGGAAIVGRLTAERLGIAALAPLTIAVLLASWVFAASRGRYRSGSPVPRVRRHRDGRAPLALVVATLLIAATEIAALLVE